MDFSSLLQAFAAKASVSDLLMTGMVGVMVYLLRDERTARSQDAKTFSDALNANAEITSRALDRNTAILDHVTGILMERGGRAS